MNFDVNDISKLLKDNQVEESLLKSFLIISRNIKAEKRTSLLKKYILSKIISIENCTEERLVQSFGVEKIDRGQILSLLDELRKKDGIVSVINGYIKVDPNKLNESTNEIHKLTGVLDSLVNSVLDNVKNEYNNPIDNQCQVKLNIKEAIIYYLVISGLSFFDIDFQKPVRDNDEICSIIENGLSKNVLLRDLIIEQLGRAIEHPSPDQQESFNMLVRVLVASRMLELDPLMRQFKATEIKDKVFILDTDVVLFALTENAPFSKLFFNLLKKLKKIGCEIYIPEEVVEEVYDHAEAATKRYHFLHGMLGWDDDYVQNVIKNIFLLDYYYSYRGGKDISVSWKTYIDSFYDKSVGGNFTKLVIADHFKDIAKIGLPENKNVNHLINQGNEDYDKLYGAALQATKDTEKAMYRDDAKNEMIAKTDTRLYLTIRDLNKTLNTDDNILLGKKYYLLTGFTRIHFCAKEVGIETGYLCNPKTLMGYMREVGLYNNDVFSYNSLFENPFLLYLSHIAKDDIDNMIKVGIDFRGVRGIIRLRKNVKDEVDTILSSVNDLDRISAYQSILNKGYHLIPELQTMFDQKKESEAQHTRDEHEKEELREEIAKLKEKIRKKDQLKKNDNRKYLRSRIPKKKKNRK